VSTAKTKNAPADAGKKVAYRVPLPASVIGLLNARQVCEALGGVSPRKFASMLARGDFPRADKRVGKSPRWSVEVVNEWVKSLPAQGGPRAEGG